MLFLFFIALGRVRHNLRQRNDGDNVGNDHEIVEHIGQLPNQIVGEAGAQEDKRDGNDGIDDHGFLSKEIGEVDLSEQIPAEDGRERKEEQTNGHQDAAQALSEE